MRRNCHLELRVVPPPPPPFIFSDHNRRQEDPSDEIKDRQNQKLTIFYDGRVSVCDVTELQARAIIRIASEEMEEKWRGISEPCSPLMICSQGGVSMKKSLQRFLQKRKHRIQSTSPYHT
ncbi:hypothetical protein SSX86_027063 [Deinandra increscens subsp. villosa]|uniref:Protein TIFY n=1 Tax=Deinandra increscens subsp. villosa TaxID=3103831 RepID=A0AAP0CG09_9ASTR